jgi:hypothetical protein
VIDALWLATRGAEACWIHAVLVESSVEDVEGAVQAGDADVALEAAWMALVWLALADMVASGRASATSELAALAAVVVTDHDVAPDLEWLVERARPTADDTHDALRRVHARQERFRSSLPIELPSMRTPQGFFPSIGLARDVEELRRLLRFDPFRWDYLAE